jgi:hypothetical protein
MAAARYSDFRARRERGPMSSALNRAASLPTRKTDLRAPIDALLVGLGLGTIGGADELDGLGPELRRIPSGHGDSLPLVLPASEPPGKAGRFSLRS